MSGAISNTQSIIVSWDIIERIEELEADQEELDDDEREELEHLLALSEEADYIADWEYGASLIHDDYFEAYAQELAIDCGFVDGDQTIYSYIDWEKWADDLKVDYTPVEFDGETYWVR